MPGAEPDGSQNRSAQNAVRADETASSLAQKPTLAILPFANMSRDPDQANLRRVFGGEQKPCYEMKGASELVGIASFEALFGLVASSASGFATGVRMTGTLANAPLKEPTGVRAALAMTTLVMMLSQRVRLMRC